MRKVLALAGSLALAAVIAAPAASADRTCYSPDFQGVPVLEKFPTTEQCIFLPVEPELR